MITKNEEDHSESINLLCTSNNRVCPNPKYWDELWHLLKKKKVDDKFITPNTPLILGSWHYTSDVEKAERMNYHIKWAEEQGQLSEIFEYLRNLPESAWHHKGDVF
jgi:hypothetical protein